MKRRRKVLIISVILIGCIVSSITLFLGDSKYNLRHFFDDWEQETKGGFLSVTYYDNLFINKKEYRMGDAYSGIQEIFCIESERIYFVYRTNGSEFPNVVWHIASCDLQFENFIEHCSSDFLVEKSDGVESSASYIRLNNYYDLETKVGGLYQNHRILLKDRHKVLIYDICTGEVIEYQDVSEWRSVLQELFPRRYIWNIHDNKEIVFTDTETGDTKTVTLEQMAAVNDYAQQIQGLESRKTWDGVPLLETFFANVEICNGEIYIIGSVSRWEGSKVAVVFHYDFPSEEIKFVTVQGVETLVEYNYYLIEQIS